MPNHDEFDLAEAIYHLKKDEVLAGVKELLGNKVPPLEIANQLSKGLEKLGEQFAAGMAFIPELVSGGEIFVEAMESLTPAIEASSTKLENLGTVLIGTVKGDLHDLGQNLVGITLTAAGFRVINLGTDVSPKRFVEETRRIKPDVIGMSALLTTTMQGQSDVIEALKAADLRENVKVIIGGAVSSQHWADEIGADAFGGDAIDGRDKVRALVELND